MTDEEIEFATPSDDDRKNFASEMQGESEQESPQCQIYTNGSGHQTFVMEKANQDLFDTTRTPDFQERLLALGFRRIVAMCEDGQTYTVNIPH